MSGLPHRALGLPVLSTLGFLLLAAAISSEPSSNGTASTGGLENIRVTDPSSGFPFQAEPSIVVDTQGRIFAAWKEMNEIGGGNRVAFGRSEDGGRTWDRGLVDGQSQSDPWLALDESGRIHYARPDQPVGEFVSHSDDGGRTWGPMVNIHDQPDDADKGSIRSDGNGTIYASYVTAGPSAPHNMKIVATRSVDGGLSWGPSRVVVNGLNPFAPAIATRPNGTAHIVWWQAIPAGGDIMVSTSTDRGMTWGTPVRVNPSRGSAVYYYLPDPKRLPYPWPATDSSGGLFVAWADKQKGEYNVVVARSDDGGATWSAPVQVNDTDTGDQWMAVVAMDAHDVLHAAWFDERTGNINLYYAFSTDGGRTWSRNLRVTDQETPAGTHSLGEYIGLAADRNGAAHLVWTDGRDGGSAIYFARTTGSAPADRADPRRPSPGRGDVRRLPPRD